MPNTLTALTLMLLSSLPASSDSWRINLDRAKAESRSSNRMLMLDFRADWCAPCKLMEAQVYTPAFLSAQSGRFIPVRIDERSRRRSRNDTTCRICPLSSLPIQWGGELMRRSGILNAQTMGALNR